MIINLPCRRGECIFQKKKRRFFHQPPLDVVNAKPLVKTSLRPKREISILNRYIYHASRRPRDTILILFSLFRTPLSTITTTKGRIFILTFFTIVWVDLRSILLPYSLRQPFFTIVFIILNPSGWILWMIGSTLIIRKLQPICNRASFFRHS